MFVVEARSRQYSKETSQVFKGYRNYYDSLDTGFQNAMHTIIAFANFIFFIGAAFVGTAINGRGWDTLFLTTAMTIIVGIALNLVASSVMPEPLEEIPVEYEHSYSGSWGHSEESGW